MPRNSPFIISLTSPTTTWGDNVDRNTGIPLDLSERVHGLKFYTVLSCHRSMLQAVPALKNRRAQKQRPTGMRKT